MQGGLGRQASFINTKGEIIIGSPDRMSFVAIPLVTMGVTKIVQQPLQPSSRTEQSGFLSGISGALRGGIVNDSVRPGTRNRSRQSDAICAL